MFARPASTCRGANNDVRSVSSARAASILATAVRMRADATTSRDSASAKTAGEVSITKMLLL